jgi:hypothetical protein
VARVPLPPFTCTQSCGQLINLPKRDNFESSPSLFLLREFEADIGAGAEPHQPQQRGTEFGHSQIIVDRRNKNNSQHNGPGENLKPMETIAAGIANQNGNAVSDLSDEFSGLRTSALRQIPWFSLYLHFDHTSGFPGHHFLPVLVSADPL